MNELDLSAEVKRLKEGIQHVLNTFTLVNEEAEEYLKELIE